MVGVIQTVLLALIRKAGGEEAVTQVLERAKIANDKKFNIDTVYPDEEWNRLLQATLEVLKLDEETAFALYSDEFCNFAMQLFPVWFNMSKNSYQFLLKQPQIHNNFATGVTDPKERKNIEDKFVLDSFEEEKKIITHYRSNNKLCRLYKSLATWIINHYKDKATISETKCLHNGDDECEIHIQWQYLNE